MAQTQSQSSLPFEAAPGAGDAALHTLSSRALPAEAGVWDELRGADGTLRDAWRRFAQALPAPAAGSELADELDRRVGQVAQRIQMDGVTHNVFSDDPKVGAAARAWSLGLLPLLIGPADWAAIEAGVVQRAELLQRMLGDLYGPQHLLREGLLPPALLLRHPGWLRPMIGVRPPGGMHLYIAAFDLARGPDGRWWQVAQRTQGPSGLGYVMHNRLVVAQQFPEAFRDLHVQRIASSYRRLLDTLESAAREVAATLGDGAPRVVLLTPGPYSETYFEHAYLARYLGVPLVEGGDLTVRGERLYLKTVEGLEPVHGLLRRLDDDWCDPLELRPDSTLGVPGLLQAARAGTVVMANALGSAFLESPAIQGFMPGVARRLMGEDLLMPSLPTWWCGEEAAWADVRHHLDDKIVRSTYPGGGRTSQVRQPQSAAVDDDPDAWTVQGRLRFSRAPIWGDGSLSPRPAMVRVYAIADGGGRWHVLPGGMTRVARREDGSVSMQRGGTSLDTWVLTDGPVDTFSMLPQRLQVDDIAQRRRPVSSRTGENLFWLGRYTERTEQLVRLARATLLLIDADNDAPPPVMQALSALCVRVGLAPHGVPTLAQSATLFERALLAGLGRTDGQDGTASVAFNLAALERASMALRERLSAEHWGLIRSMREGFAQALHTAPGVLPTRTQVLPALDHLALQLAAVTGAQSDRMTRDHGWRLMTVGRLTERLIAVSTRLRMFLENEALGSAAGIDLLLELFDSIITFRARYQRHQDLLAVTDMLVLDSAIPRSFAGVLRRLRTEIGKLPGPPEAQQPLLDLLPAEGAGLTLESLRGADEAAIAQALRSLSVTLGHRAAALADCVSERFFTLAQGVDQRV
ncbi:MAG: circularly permuted type 2 ATP-grasp protein [Rubrivivax sp.]|nr:circularly permuted type 2 ATP-grasp protein [Rubrivivax sp.]